MPIRMTPDDPGNSRRTSGPTPSRSAGGGGMAGGLGSMLPMILGFLIKKPKLLIVVLILGAIWWFTMGRNQRWRRHDQPTAQGLAPVPTSTRSCMIRPRCTNRSADNVKPHLPERVSLAAVRPPRLNQGQQGSCVAWASAYAARTIVQAKATGAGPQEHGLQSERPCTTRSRSTTAIARVATSTAPWSK